jgi:hypothetical protein
MGLSADCAMAYRRPVQSAIEDSIIVESLILTAMPTCFNKDNDANSVEGGSILPI